MDELTHRPERDGQLVGVHVHPGSVPRADLPLQQASAGPREVAV
jgi:hypothetical protein